MSRPDANEPSRRWIVSDVLRAVLLGLGLLVVAGPSSAASDAAQSPDAQYLKFLPDLIVNLHGPDGPHFLMVTVQAMSQSSDGVEKLKHHMPALRHHLLMLLGEQSPQTIRTVEAKKRLMSKALEVVQGFMTEETGEPVVEAIYFTSFVLE